MEVRKLLKTYRIHMQCPKCSAGEMEFLNNDRGINEIIGELLLDGPPKYINKCNVCGYEKEFPYMYPRMDSEEVDS